MPVHGYGIIDNNLIAYGLNARRLRPRVAHTQRNICTGPVNVMICAMAKVYGRAGATKVEYGCFLKCSNSCVCLCDMAPFGNAQTCAVPLHLPTY